MADQPPIRLDAFEQSDFSTLRDVVMSRGDLHAAALACKVIQERCSFPILSAGDILEAVFESPGSAFDLADHVVTVEDAKAFLTPDLFPIEDEADLAARILLAFDRRNTVASARDIIDSFERLASGATASEALSRGTSNG